MPFKLQVWFFITGVVSKGADINPVTIVCLLAITSIRPHVTVQYFGSVMLYLVKMCSSILGNMQQRVLKKHIFVS